MGGVNETDRIPLPRSPRGVLGHSVLEVAAWLAALTTGGMVFAVAGMVGFSATMPAKVFGYVTPQQRAGDFDVHAGAGGLLVVAVLVVAGIVIPARAPARLKAAVRSRLLVAAAVLSAICAIVFVFYPAVCWGWLTALFLGSIAALATAHAPELHRKPWRNAGIATVIMVVVLYAVQLESGTPAGTGALRWLLLAAAILLIIAAALVFVSPLDMADASYGGPASGAEVPRARRGRAPTAVRRPWACIMLFGVLGVVFVLAVPDVADYAFGPAAFALIVAAALLGWAAGNEAGPTFAPGMARPRLTAFALAAAGLLTIATGLLAELSGKAVLTAVIAFCVGVGVRAQDYQFARRIGVGAGVAAALLIVCFAPRTIVLISPATSWTITPTSVAYGIVGLAALIGGVVAIFTFPPQGPRGLGVDVVHAFRVPEPGDAGGGLPPSAGDFATSGEGTKFTTPAARMPQRGLFIAIEGPDGSGKSTQAELLRERLHTQGVDGVVTREPGGTPVGTEIRSVLLDGEATAPRAEALLYAADRAQHMSELIGPTLAAGGIVITDRYIDSSLAYQAAGRALDETEILSLSRWATEGIVPQLTVVLDIPPEATAARTAARGAQNHLDAESAQFHARVRRRFLELAAAQPDRYVVIDADAPADQVAARVAAAVDQAVRDRGVQLSGKPVGDRGETAACEEATTVLAPSAGGAQGAHRSQPAASADSHATDPLASDSADRSAQGDSWTSSAAHADAARQARDDADEDETTVLQRPGVPVPPYEDIAPAVAPGESNSVTASPERSVEPESSPEAETTVLPPRVNGSSAVGAAESEAVGSGAASSAAASGVQPGQLGEAGHSVGPDPSWKPGPSRDSGREKLRAQAEIERRARERLRQARSAESRSSSSEPGPPRGERDAAPNEHGVPRGKHGVSRDQHSSAHGEHGVPRGAGRTERSHQVRDDPDGSSPERQRPEGPAH